MIYRVSNEFVKINETSGTIQNTGSCYVIELSDRAEKGSGFLLNPRQSITFSGELFARRTGNDTRAVDLRVVPFFATQGGAGGSGGISDEQVATDSDLNELMDDVFSGGESSSLVVPDEQVATDDDLHELMDEVFNP